MRLKAMMVKLIPDEEVILASKKFASKDAVFLSAEKYPWKLKMGIESVDQCFITASHMNVDHDFYYIPAFQLIELEDGDTSKNYILKCFPKKGTESTILYYDERYDIFYDFPAVKLEKNKDKTKGAWHYCNDLGKASVGSINAGVFYLNVYDAGTEEKINVKPYKMIVIPSSMSMQQYEDMVNDLLNIKRELIIEKDNRGKQSLQLSWQHSLEEFKAVVAAIAEPLRRINQDPKTTLRKEYGKISPKNIKKFDSRILVDLVVYPGKDRCVASIVHESNDTYENQILLYKLSSLESYLNNFSDYIEKQLISDKQKNDAEIQKILDLYGVDSLDSMYRILEHKDMANFYDLMQNRHQNVEADDEKTIEVEIAIIKNSEDFQFSMYFAGGKLHSKYLGKWIDDPQKRYSLDYERGTYIIINDDGPSEVQIRGRRASVELVSSDEHQHLQLYCAMHSVGVRNICLRAKVKITGYDPDDLLRGKPVFSYPNLYDYDLKVINIISINGAGVGDSIKNETQNLKKIYIYRGYILNRTEIMKQIYMLRIKQQRINEELTKHRSYNTEAIAILTDELRILMRLDFFKNVTLRANKWKLTQIFSNHKHYKKLYKLLNSLDKKFQFSDSVNTKDVIHKKADKLYEYWILVKILYLLTRQQQWQLQGGESIVSLISRILKDNKSCEIEDSTFTLTHQGVESGKIIMELIFNRECHGLTPDFAFHVTVTNGKGEVKKSNWYYLDAKYKNYDSMGSQWWYYDINKVAIKKYINHFVNTDEAATASFIIHTDEQEKYVYFGGYFDKDLCEHFTDYTDDNPKHRFGSFSFLPDHTENFMIFMKLIIEYHFMDEELWRICWDCGSSDTSIPNDKRTIGGNKKYHITCNNCSSFWVRNHCEKNTDHKLVKHATKNYHKEELTGDPWYVKCPVCDYV